jgi:hypothetical protein
MSDDVATWRRRERALSLGACVWASVVGLLVQVERAVVTTWLADANGLAVASTIMVTLAVAAGLADGLQVLVGWYRNDGSDGWRRHVR